jgi:hypothetical protein
LPGALPALVKAARPINVPLESANHNSASCSRTASFGGNSPDMILASMPTGESTSKRVAIAGTVSFDLPTSTLSPTHVRSVNEHAEIPVPHFVKTAIRRLGISIRYCACRCASFLIPSFVAVPARSILYTLRQP